MCSEFLVQTFLFVVKMEKMELYPRSMLLYATKPSYRRWDPRCDNFSSFMVS